MKISNQKINLKDWEFEYQQREAHPILMADQWCRSLYSNLKSEINLPIPRIDYLITGLSRGYVRHQHKQKIINELGGAVAKPEYLELLHNRTHERVSDFKSISNKINKRIAKRVVSVNELADMWQEFDKVFMTIVPWLYIPWYVIEDNLITDKIKAKLNKYKSEIEKITDFNNALMILVFPVKKVLLQTEQDDFYKLIQFVQGKKKFEKNKNFLELANKYLKKYAWIKTFFFLPINPLTIKELIRNIKQEINNNGLEEHRLQRVQNLKNKKLAKSLIKIIDSDKELMRQIKSAQKFGWLLSWSVENFLITAASLIPWYKLIAKNLKIKYSQWTLLTYSEVLDGLKNGLKIKETELKKREISYIVLIKQGKLVIETGLVAKKLSEDINHDVGAMDIVLNHVTGQPTSPGKVQGRVKIVKFAKNSYNIKEGEVLVCSMTSPDYLLAMKRAVAIVTDEGGLLCHAAIISRELGKPCIVGTRNASKVLVDGDLVEVDADNGTVKILNKF